MLNFKKIALVGASVIAIVGTSAIAADRNWATPQDSTLWDKTWRYTDDFVEINRRNHIRNDYVQGYRAPEVKRAQAPVRMAPAKPQEPDYQEFPPNPRLGECYARVQIPPVYKTVEEQVMVKKGGIRYEIVPSQYKFVEERVLVQESQSELQVTAATYKKVQVKVLVKEAYNEIVNIPAEYKTVEEKVLSAPAYSTWKKGKGPIEKIDHLTGDIMCLVEIPAEYKTIQKTVLVSAAATKTIKHPAEYQTIEKNVLDKAATTKQVQVSPAKFDIIKVKKLAKAAYKKAIKIDPVFETVTRRIATSGGNLEWRSILCETNATPALFKAVQRQLKAKSLYAGEITSTLTAETMDAVEVFQKSQNLPTGNLTISTLKALGITNKDFY
jgi:hypothetical protein